MEISEIDPNNSNRREEASLGPVTIAPQPSSIIGNFIMESVTWFIVLGLALVFIVYIVGLWTVGYSTMREIMVPLGWMLLGGLITLGIMAKCA